MGLFDRNWAGEALSRAASALAAFRYGKKDDEDLTDEERAAMAAEEAAEKKKRAETWSDIKEGVTDAAYTVAGAAYNAKERVEDYIDGRKDRRLEKKREKKFGDDGNLVDFPDTYAEDGAVIPEMSEDSLVEAAHKIYTDDAVMFGRDRKIANDWARQVTDDAFIESIVKTEAGEQQYIQLVEMLAQFIEMSKKYFRENYGTPEDPIEKGTFMAAYKRHKSGKNVYEAKGVKDTLPWQAYEQALMMLERSDVSFRIESGVPTIRRRGVIMPLAEDQRNPQPFMPQLTQIQQPESTMQ